MSHSLPHKAYWTIPIGGHMWKIREMHMGGMEF